MAFTKLKNQISSLATPFLSNVVSNLAVPKSAKDAGSFAASLKEKSPFNIGQAPNQEVLKNPLSFSPVQYPLDLGNEQLGHYIMFESGFVSYSPQKAGLIQGQGRRERYTSRLPRSSITNSAIALYMPKDLKVSYKQTYSPEAAGIAGDIEAGMAAGSIQAGNTAEQIKTFLEAGTNSILKIGKSMVGEAISVIPDAGDPIKFIAKRAGLAVNPRNEQFYDSPDFRTFSYTFDFWPRNSKEAKAVADIIYIFKYNSSPGLRGKSGALFNAPNYFRISYYQNDGTENHKLHKIAACYCTGVSVDYAPDEQPTFFKDGYPVHSNLTVEFIEDRILTKNDIEAGA